MIIITEALTQFQTLQGGFVTLAIAVISVLALGTLFIHARRMIRRSGD